MFYTFSKRGSYHRVHSIENQDRIFLGNKGNLICSAISDGAGSAIFGGIGAEISCCTAGRFLLYNFERLYCESSVKTISSEILGTVLRELKVASANLLLNANIDALGSTLLVICLDRKSGRYISLHIGDGLAAYVVDREIHIISAPANGITRHHTTLTSSQDCINRCRIHRGEKKFASFLLMTDGCTSHIWNKSSFWDGSKGLLLNHDWAGIERYLYDKSPEDDYTFVAISDD